jgi:hypothetical protein
MPVVLESTNKFLNDRDWRTFLAAAQSAASCPSVLRAVQAGQAWLSDSAAKTSSWLLVDGTLVTGARKTLGI